MRKTGQNGSVENPYEYKNHDVVGEDKQAKIAALIVVGTSVNVRSLSTFDHRDDRLHLRAMAISGAVKPLFHQASVTAGWQFIGGATVLGGNDGPNAMPVASELMIRF